MRVHDATVVMFSDAYDDYSVELARSLADRVKRLVLVQPIDSKRFDASELGASVETLRMRRRRIRDPRSFVDNCRMAWAIKGATPDLLLMQQSGDPTINLVFSALLPRVPTVMTIHDGEPHPGDKTYRSGANLTQRLLGKRIDRFIVHSQSVRTVVTAKWGLDPQRTAVMPHGELGSLYRRRCAHDAAPREQNRLLFFGRRWRYKGLHVLVEALQVLDSRGWDEPIRLVIAGKGEHFEKNFPGRPEWLDIQVNDSYLTNCEVVAEFDAATLAILPYIEASQSGVAALALGLGTPIVASKVGGLNEVLSDECAFLTEPGDPVDLADRIELALNDPSSRDTVAAKGLRLATTDLSWEKIAETHARIFAPLLEQSPGTELN